jgi:hypothetical protein
MYNKATIDKIAGMLGLNAEEFATGFTSEDEVELKLAEGRFLTKEQEETLKDNHGKTRYDAGSEAAREMQLKDMSKLVGFEESIKDPQKFIETFKANILKQAKIEPDKKVSELEASLETLRNTILEKDTANSNLQSEIKNIQTRTKLLGAIPKLADIGLKNDDVLDLFLKSHEIKDDAVYYNGTVLQDDMAKNMPVEKVLNTFVSERGWDYKDDVDPRGRKKNPNPNPGGGNTFEDYENEIKEKGLHPGGQEAQALLKTYVENNPEILT